MEATQVAALFKSYVERKVRLHHATRGPISSLGTVTFSSQVSSLELITVSLTTVDDRCVERSLLPFRFDLDSIVRAASHCPCRLLGHGCPHGVFAATRAWKGRFSATRRYMFWPSLTSSITPSGASEHANTSPQSEAVSGTVCSTPCKNGV